MASKTLWGWYPGPPGVWVKLQVDNVGRLVLDPALLFEEPPVNGELEKGATSNWCFDHEANPTAHGDKEFFVPVTFGEENGVVDILTNYATYPVARLTAAGDFARVAFKVPHDFTAITNAEFIVIPRSTQAAAGWSIRSTFAATGEAYNTHTIDDGATTYNVTNDQIYAVDLSGILVGLAANDFVGIHLYLRNAAHDVDALGIRFRYS